MKRIVPLLLAALLLAGCNLLPAPGATGAASVNIAAAADRAVQARLYEGKRLALAQRSVDDAAQIIAGLKPTWVSGIIKLDQDNELNVAQVAAYTRVQDIVRAQSPGCLFDFVLDADQYTGTALADKMREINATLKVDLWYLEDLSKAYDKAPDVIRAALDYAHSAGQPVGGEVSGSKAPEGVDFVAVDDGDGVSQLKSAAGKLGAGGLPVLAHIRSTSVKGSGNAPFLAEMDAAGRVGRVEELAGEQAAGGFRLLYPVFYPLDAGKTAYDAAADGDMLGRIAALLDAGVQK